MLNQPPPSPSRRRRLALALVAAAALTGTVAAQVADPRAGGQQPTGNPTATEPDLAAAVVAAEGSPAVADARSLGELIAAGGGPGGIGAACMTCHGVGGQGDAAAGFPMLAGLDPLYLANQLDHFADGSRPNAIMTPIAAALTPEQREAVAIYYAGLLPPEDYRRDEDALLAREGAVLYAIGNADRGIQACQNCHGPRGVGLHSAYPALAGQNATYILGELTDFRSGDRAVNAAMTEIALRMTDEDMHAAAAYLSSLRP